MTPQLPSIDSRPRGCLALMGSACWRRLRMLAAAVLVGALAGNPCQAFKITDLWGSHEEITVTALAFLKADQLDWIIDQHNEVDDDSSDDSKHFDDCNFEGGASHIRDWYTKAIESATADRTLEEYFGEALHGVQDFYSHSSWVELWVRGYIKTRLVDDETTTHWRNKTPWTRHLREPNVMLPNDTAKTEWGNPQVWFEKHFFFDTLLESRGGIIRMDYDDSKKIRQSVYLLDSGWWLGDNLCYDTVERHHDFLAKDNEKFSKLFPMARDFAVDQTLHEWDRLLELYRQKHGKEALEELKGRLIRQLKHLKVDEDLRWPKYDYPPDMKLEEKGFPSLETALRAAEPLATIELAPGSYDRSEIGQKVTLTRSGSSGVVTLRNGSSVTTDDGKTLIVRGSGKADVIRLSGSGSQTKVVINGTESAVPAGDYSKVIAYGYGGSDIIYAMECGNLVELHGGPGDDILQGGGRTVIQGGVLQPHLLYGEGGKDTAVSSLGFFGFDGGPDQDGILFMGTDGDDSISVEWYPMEKALRDGALFPPFVQHRDGLRVRINENVFEMDYTPQDLEETIVIRGGKGNDRIVMSNDGAGQHWNAEFHGDEGDDVLVGASRVYHRPRGNDRMFGGAGNDTLIGNAGDDFLDGGPGADILDSGWGRNTVVTDGQDIVMANTGDLLRYQATFPEAKAVTINWGDGRAEKVNALDLYHHEDGNVVADHIYDGSSIGLIRVTLEAQGPMKPFEFYAEVLQHGPPPDDERPVMRGIVRIQGGGVRLEMIGIPNTQYVIQGTSNLGAPQWGTLAEVAAGSNGTFEFLVPDAAGVPAGFYRAVQAKHDDE